MVCKSILKDSALEVLYEHHRWCRRRWIWRILLALIASSLIFAITKSYWFVALFYGSFILWYAAYAYV